MAATKPSPGLHADDFVLCEEGQPQPIRGFGNEDLPVDVLFLLDVSASMRLHVQRIAEASGQALTVLGKDDRMGIMVFDRSTHVLLPFSTNREDVHQAFDRLQAATGAALQRYPDAQVRYRART